MYWAVHITMLTFGTATMGGKLTFVYCSATPILLFSGQFFNKTKHKSSKMFWLSCKTNEAAQYDDTQCMWDESACACTYDFYDSYFSVNKVTFNVSFRCCVSSISRNLWKLSNDDTAECDGFAFLLIKLHDAGNFGWEHPGYTVARFMEIKHENCN